MPYTFNPLSGNLDYYEPAIATSGTITKHSDLSELDYASSGHTGFSPTSHTHTEGQITDLDKYTQAKVNTISGSLQTDIDGKSDIGHAHTYRV